MATTSLPLTDPTKVEAEVTPADIDRVIPPSTDKEKALFKLTKEMFDASATARQPFEEMAAVSLAFYLGRQGVSWNATTRRLDSVRSRSPYRVHQYRNKIRPKIKKGLAVALRNDPDVTISPWSAVNADRAAAMIGRAVDDHYRIALKRRQGLWKAARWAVTTSTYRRKYWWDPHAWAEVPTGFDDDRNPSGSSLQRVGNIKTCDVNWFECYPDPDAREESEIRWIIHAFEASLDRIQDEYEDGWMVGGGSPDGLRSNTETRLAGIVGGYPKGTAPGRAGRTQTIYEVHHKPNLLYPENWTPPTGEELQGSPHHPGHWQGGAWWTCAGDGRVLTQPQSLPEWCRRATDGEWELPFNPLNYETPQGTVHGLNGVHDNIGAQRDYNNSVSRMAEIMRNSYGKILACTGAEIASTSFDSAKDNEVIYWRPNAGGAPTQMKAPEAPGFVMDSLELADHDMQDITGVHEVSEGNAPPQVTAASALKLLTDNDTTQIADFTQEIEGFVERDSDKCLRIARAYFKEPRFLFLAQTKGTKTNALPGPKPAAPNVAGAAGGIGGALGTDPGSLAGGMGTGSAQPQGSPQTPPPPTTVMPQDLPSPLMQATTFEAFAAGSLRVMVTPGSATPKSPEASAELVLELIKLGVFTMPAPIARTILEELEIMDSNRVYEDILQANADALAQAQALQAMQPDPATAALKQAQLQGQIAQIMEAVKVHGQIEVIKAKALADAEAKALELHGDVQLEYVRAKLAAMTPPKVSLQGKMGSTATVSAEKMAGLEGDDESEIKQRDTAPKPLAAGADGKGSSNGTATKA